MIDQVVSNEYVLLQALLVLIIVPAVLILERIFFHKGGLFGGKQK